MPESDVLKISVIFRVGTAGEHQCMPNSGAVSSTGEAVYSLCTFALPAFKRHSLSSWSIAGYVPVL